MILLHIFSGVNRPTEIAKELGITVPGVQYHLKILKEKSFVTEENTLTNEGFEFLYGGLNGIRTFVSDNITKLDKVITWEALCDEAVKKGDRVYLHMTGGYLHASGKTKSGSSGIAETDGIPPDVIGVSNVEGMIEVKVRDFSIIVLPDVETIRSKDSISQEIRKKHEEAVFDYVGILGEEAKLIAQKAELEVNFEFSPIEAAFEAASRGQSSMVLISRRRFHFILTLLKELENRNPGIKVNIEYIKE